MNSVFINYIYLLLIISFLVMAAQRIRIAYPIVLVLGGLVLSLVHIFPVVAIEPELIFVIFLPPILYEAAWQTSWKDFWKWRRIILSFAFLVVIATSSLVAYVSSSLIPGFTLALGFLLGGIVSPPDAVSATSIMKEVSVPKRISAIIEGESLLNDAASIIVFRFAVAAVTTGSFVLKTAATDFVVVILMGALIGLAIAFVFYAIHRWLPTTATIDLVLTFVTPYIMYIVAEHFHFSGVLSVVCGGLLLSGKRQTMLSPMSRIQAVNVWSIISFVLNGLIFMLIGLQLPVIVQQLGDTSLWQAIKYSLIIALTLIVSRLLIALGTSVFTMVASRFITTADSRPGFRAPLVLGWAGMRGVVSLAAALSIPLTIDGAAFPQRNLILFITFSVILITLVLQGLTLPLVIRLVKPKDPDYQLPEIEQEVRLQESLSRRALKLLEEKDRRLVHHNDLVQTLKRRFENNLMVLDYMDRPEKPEERSRQHITDYEAIHREIINEQRKLLQQINKKEGISEDLVKKYLLALDQEEEALKEKLNLF